MEKLRKILKNPKVRKRLKIYFIVRIPLLVYTILALLTVPSINAVQNSEIKEHNTILGAHRGNSTEFTENTLPAFESALEDEKYKFIEFDIQLTKDGKIAVIHQNNMFRIPKTDISNQTYEESMEKLGFYMPQYQEVMDLINAQKPVNIEIKSCGDFEKDKQLVDFIIKDCTERKICEKFLLSSPSEEIVRYIEETYSEVKSGRVYWITPLSVIPLESTTEWFYEESQADYLLLHGYNLKNIDLLLKYKPENKKLIFWYFTDEAYILDCPEETDEFWEVE